MSELSQDRVTSLSTAQNASIHPHSPSPKLLQNFSCCCQRELTSAGSRCPPSCSITPLLRRQREEKRWKKPHGSSFDCRADAIKYGISVWDSCPGYVFPKILPIPSLLLRGECWRGSLDAVAKILLCASTFPGTNLDFWRIFSSSHGQGDVSMLSLCCQGSKSS